jgi:hypothetical protein
MSTNVRFMTRLALAGAATALALSLTACKSQNQQQAQVAQQAQVGPDPALANMYPNGQEPAGTTTGAAAPVTRVAGQSETYQPQQQGESYPQQSAPTGDDSYNNYQPTYSNDYTYDQDYDPGYASGSAQYEQAEQAPPPLPEYDQPPAPGPDYYWTPGYWNYGSGGYYWVPGVWVAPPYYGALWTPPYWGWYGGHYRFHRGYWGHHVGFYGGVNYGFGYVGVGYFGGYWNGNSFYYNRAVTNVGGVRNYYSRPVVYDNRTYGAQPVDRVSYNGGRGGIQHAPMPAEREAMREQHAPPVPAQIQARSFAQADPQQRFATNQGRPQNVAFDRPAAVQAAAQHANIPVRPLPNVAAGHPGEAQPAGNRPGEANSPAIANRPGEPNRAEPNRAEPNRAGQPVNAGAPSRPGELNRPNVPGAMAHPEAPANNRGFEGRPNTPAQPEARTAQPAPRAAQPAPQPMRENRQPERSTPAPQARPEAARPAPAPHVEAARPAPAPHVEAARPAPAPHVEAARPAPAPHAEAPRPAPAARPAPEAHPAPAAHAAPAPHAEEHGHR